MLSHIVKSVLTAVEDNVIIAYQTIYNLDPYPMDKLLISHIWYTAYGPVQGFGMCFGKSKSIIF